jgi:hypothetical protein
MERLRNWVREGESGLGWIESGAFDTIDEARADVEEKFCFCDDGD